MVSRRVTLNEITNNPYSTYDNIDASCVQFTDLQSLSKDASIVKSTDNASDLIGWKFRCSLGHPS